MRFNSRRLLVDFEIARKRPYTFYIAYRICIGRKTSLTWTSTPDGRARTSRPNDKYYLRRTDRRSSTCRTWGPRLTGRHTWKTWNRQNKYYIRVQRWRAPIVWNHIPNHLRPKSRVSRVTRVTTHLARHELGYVLPLEPQTGTWCGAQLHGSPVCLYLDTALTVAGSQCFFVQVISPAKQLHVLQSISNVDPWSVTPNKWSLQFHSNII